MSIRRTSNNIIRLVEAFVAVCPKPVGELEIVSTSDKETLLRFATGIDASIPFTEAEAALELQRQSGKDVHFTARLILQSKDWQPSKVGE